MSAPQVQRWSVPEVGRGRAWRRDGLHGRAYAPLPDALAAALPRWLATLDVPEGTVLKAGGVHRVGHVVVKLFTQPSLLGWVRAPRAVRSAERHFWCLPLRSPRPWVAAGRALRRDSVLVREHVDGVTLRELGSDARAEAALAEFLGVMEARGVIHGDLHPRNLLWTGAEWVLLDVDGLRHGLHDRERVFTAQWARFVVHLGDEERVRALHRHAGARIPWERVRARVEALRAERGGVSPA